MSSRSKSNSESTCKLNANLGSEDSPRKQSTLMLSDTRTGSTFQIRNGKSNFLKEEEGEEAETTGMGTIEETIALEVREGEATIEIIGGTIETTETIEREAEGTTITEEVMIVEIETEIMTVEIETEIMIVATIEEIVMEITIEEITEIPEETEGMGTEERGTTRGEIETTIGTTIDATIETTEGKKEEENVEMTTVDVITVQPANNNAKRDDDKSKIAFESVFLSLAL